jgi:predicted Zn-dependent peptidase
MEKEFPIFLPLFCIGVKECDLEKDGCAIMKRELEHTLILEILFGRGSRLFERLYDEGLINQKFDASYQVAVTFSHTVISGESRDVDAVYEAIKQELEDYRLGRAVISDEDLERARALTFGTLVQVWNSTTDTADTFLDYELIGADPLELPEVLESITRDDLVRRLERSYAPDAIAISRVVPKKGEKE